MRRCLWTKRRAFLTMWRCWQWLWSARHGWLGSESACWLIYSTQTVCCGNPHTARPVACSSRFKAAGAVPYLPLSFNHPCRSMKGWVRHEKADFVGVQDYFCFRVTSSSFKKEANKYSETFSWREGFHLLARRQAEQDARGCSSAYRKLGWCCCPGDPAWLPQLGWA